MAKRITDLGNAVREAALDGKDGRPDWDEMGSDEATAFAEALKAVLPYLLSDERLWEVFLETCPHEAFDGKGDAAASKAAIDLWYLLHTPGHTPGHAPLARHTAPAARITAKPEPAVAVIDAVTPQASVLGVSKGA